MSYFKHETVIIDEGAVIGDGTKIWHFGHVSKNVRIGENCSFGQNVYIAENVTIGNNCKIQNNVSIYQGVNFEDYVFCGPSVVFTNIKTPRTEFPQNKPSEYLRTLLKRGVSVGANATIICGIILHEYCFVAAGSVVTKDVPPYSMVLGNPARVVGFMGVTGEKLKFDLQGIAVDSIGNKYKILTENRVERFNG